MENLAIVVSVLSLGFSLYVYFDTDRRIKKQENRINNYTLEKIEKEKENAQKALIDASLHQVMKGHYQLTIYNKGEAKARNVQVLLPDLEDTYFPENPTPFELRPSKDIMLDCWFTISTPTTIQIEISWTDDFMPFNKDMFTFYL